MTRAVNASDMPASVPRSPRLADATLRMAAYDSLPFLLRRAVAEAPYSLDTIRLAEGLLRVGAEVLLAQIRKTCADAVAACYAERVHDPALRSRLLAACGIKE